MQPHRPSESERGHGETILLPDGDPKILSGKRSTSTVS
ncbi:hypothetical protein Rhow_000085 [Rhodococcus wratislaviensis]|uniref:Uncharacterized protein n=1 Tax=Rhodococcus wratislaviensis TaxID=44752 RepID=A0A402BXL6_RHOWR|nr:hypothetical protein Rhow_000085 [Rhodococcus wratislaviensis]